MVMCNILEQRFSLLYQKSTHTTSVNFREYHEILIQQLICSIQIEDINFNFIRMQHDFFRNTFEFICEKLQGFVKKKEHIGASQWTTSAESPLLYGVWEVVLITNQLANILAWENRRFFR